MLGRNCKLLSLCAVLLPGRVPPVAAGGAPPPHARAFELAFLPGSQIAVGDRNVRFRIFDAGRLRISSGRIKACDPFVGMNRPPFTVGVPKGEFAVRLALVDGGRGSGGLAFARVDFSPERVARWEMALTTGQDLATLKADEIFGYPVDAGIGSFVDADTATVADSQMRADENLSERWIDEGERKTPPMFYLDVDFDPGNVIMFTSGWGDGFYASWFGYDAQGRVAALVTDFLVVDWSEARW
jgi:hypothetical protein